MAEHLSVRASIKGTSRECPLTGEPERRGFRKISEMPCRRASLFIRDRMGNLEAFVCRDFWEKRKV